MRKFMNERCYINKVICNMMKYNFMNDQKNVIGKKVIPIGWVKLSSPLNQDYKKASQKRRT